MASESDKPSTSSSLSSFLPFSFCVAFNDEQITIAELQSLNRAEKRRIGDAKNESKDTKYQVSHFLKKHEGMKIKGESNDFYRVEQETKTIRLQYEPDSHPVTLLVDEFR